jgi:catechol 2,3-dioxygenase-like lactoylglutathione lyase family enzyme
MGITRIESLVFGVADMDVCKDFYVDAGFKIDVDTPTRTVLYTPERQTVVLQPLDDPALPKAAESGPTLRELIWGVKTQADLERIAKELSRDRVVEYDAYGVVHSHDEGGLGIGFMVERSAIANDEPPTTYNTLRHVARWNEPVHIPSEPRPLRMVHIAINIKKEGHVEAIDFYLKRLGFKATDQILDTGTFMQCEDDVEHHNLFLCHRPDSAGFNHFAVEVRDFDAVVQAGNHMVSHGWKESRVLGRHLLGSNLYRFFTSPAGGRLEFVTDMDRIDKSMPTRVWETNPGHHVWSLRSTSDENVV